jgi:hypothetical protein
MSRLPIIGVTACSTQIGLYAYHISGDFCFSAEAAAAPSLSVILPSMANLPSPSDILDGRDGTPITVTPFNIEPIHNSGSAFVLGIAHDSARLAFSAVSETGAKAGRRHAIQRDADASNIA